MWLGLNLLVCETDKTGKENAAKLAFTSDFLNQMLPAKNLDTSNLNSMATLAKMLEKAAENSTGHLDSNATNLGTAATNLRDNGLESG